MLTHSSTYNISIASGSSTSIPSGAENYNYLVTGSRNFSGNAFQITMSGAPATNTTRFFIFDVTPTNYDAAGGDHLTVLGTQVPQSLLGATGTFSAVAHYNGSSWRVQFYPSWGEANIVSNNEMADDAIGQSEMQNNSIGTLELIDSNTTLAKIEDITQNRVLGRISAGSGVVEQLTLAQIVSFLGLDYTATGEVTGTASQQSDGTLTVALTLGNGVVEVVNCDNNVNRAIVSGILSFETNELGFTAIKMPYKCQVEDFACTVISPIHSGGDGTIKLYDHSGSQMVGDTNEITVTGGTSVASTSGGVAAASFNMSNIDTNSDIGDSERIIFETIKAGTAGGKVMFSMRVKKVV